MTLFTKLKERIFCCIFSVLLLLGGCAQPPSPAAESQDFESDTIPELSQYFCAQYPSYTLPEAVAHATTIVYAEIVTIQPAYEETNGGVGTPVIMTPIELSPIESLKGKHSTFIYRRLGGDYDGTRYLQQGSDIHLKEGQKVVAFLNAYERDIGPTWFLLETDGTIRYQPDPYENDTTASTEEFLSLIRQELASAGESQAN